MHDNDIDEELIAKYGNELDAIAVQRSLTILVGFVASSVGVLCLSWLSANTELSTFARYVATLVVVLAACLPIVRLRSRRMQRQKHDIVLRMAIDRSKLSTNPENSDLDRRSHE